MAFAKFIMISDEESDDHLNDQGGDTGINVLEPDCADTTARMTSLCQTLLLIVSPYIIIYIKFYNENAFWDNLFMFLCWNNL